MLEDVLFMITNAGKTSRAPRKCDRNKNFQIFTRNKLKRCWELFWGTGFQIQHGPLNSGLMITCTLLSPNTKHKTNMFLNAFAKKSIIWALIPS